MRQQQFGLLMQTHIKARHINYKKTKTNFDRKLRINKIEFLDIVLQL